MTHPTGRPAGAHLERVAIDVGDRAAELVRGHIGRAAAAGTKSSPTDVVTATDVTSEALIRRELIARCPGSSIVGEELSDAVGSNTVGWVVDPIDGTVNFLYDLPVVAVSIAATIDGVTVAGAVVDVVRGETFSAHLGGGARLDGTAIAVGQASDMSTALIGTGFAYDAERRRAQARVLGELLSACRDIRCMGSAALNLCWIGNGRLDAYYEQNTKLYDYAAGALIAAEAGARVELPDSNDLDLVIAASASIFGPLRALVDAA